MFNSSLNGTSIRNRSCHSGPVPREEHHGRRARLLTRYLELAGVSRPTLALVAVISAAATAAEGGAIVVLARLAAAVMAGSPELTVGRSLGPLPSALSLGAGFAAFGALLAVRTAAMGLASKLAADA